MMDSNFRPAPGNAPARNLQTPSEIDRLEKDLHSLHDAIVLMETRLTPCLRPPAPPTPVDPKIETALVPIAARIAQMRRMVADAHDKIMGLVERLEV